ncbi:hypothetical protein P152DRAFT_90383 [Eremomyces bilateralis CBS 781.70]|uniref:Integral membrane protein, Mpv17/PMP22 family n=1 Tax=Eremomyces bilateralis CBS 781.70 TaxID=1392243 RepID=A0A6G1FXH9_9PEZI|nr:uncharacterized protein P152DRAFT_90383 [Eremomyces bilateralis CBS 781.70]KAF1810605.1 hypothetical protein P152DRAFT_90383 [Eremomyces bilateralis CBS 781.70]
MVLRWYQAKLAARPILTQSITTAVLFAAGDTLAQQAVEKRGLNKHDFSRTGRMAGYGGAVFGPAATFWYRLLSRVNLQRPALVPPQPTGTRPPTDPISIPLPPPAPARHFPTILARVALDQAVFAPTNMAVFLSSMAYLEGGSAREKLRKTWWTGMKKNFLVWPGVQVVNFGWVPLEHRVLVVNVVALGWNCYLSYINSQ